VCHSYLTGPTVQVVVGADELSKTFSVHRDLITSRSKFFAKALRNYGEGDDGNITWREGEEGTVKLPEDSQDVFTQYLQLLYCGHIPVGKQFVGDTEAMSYKERIKAVGKFHDQEYVALGKLYVFCEKVRDVQSKATLITAFVETSQKVRGNGLAYFPSTVSTRIVYDGTLHGDPLRQWLVGGFSLRAHEAWFEEDKAESYNQQFMFDVMAEMAKRRAQVDDYSEIQTAEQYCKQLLEAEE